MQIAADTDAVEAGSQAAAHCARLRRVVAAAEFRTSDDLLPAFPQLQQAH